MPVYMSRVNIGFVLCIFAFTFVWDLLPGKLSAAERVSPSISSVDSKSELQGRWALVSGEYVNYEGKLVQYSELDLKSIKLISNDYFSFVTMSGDKFWSSGTGTFETKNGTYIESPIYTSFNSPQGKTYTFDYQLKGDFWHTSRWENGVRVEYEIWQKIGTP